jgi:hypothetical protein
MLELARDLTTFNVIKKYLTQIMLKPLLFSEIH